MKHVAFPFPVPISLAIAVVVTALSGTGCGGDETTSASGTGPAASNAPSGGGPSSPPADPKVTPPLPQPGNPNGGCAIPKEAEADDVSKPTAVVGSGTPASCTAQAFAAAVAKAGVITFDCGPEPVTITVPEIKIVNDAGAAKNGDMTIDGGGKITLSGGGKNRILYQNTCDEAQHWTTSHCNDQEHPRLSLQNIALANGNATATQKIMGGGALYVQGGTLKLVNTTFVSNKSETLGSDFAGGAIYAVQMHAPIFVSGSTFGGAAGTGNSAASGGALGSIGVSWTILNSRFEGNAAMGAGMSSGNGGNGGAIYNDGNTYTLSLCGTEVISNRANELGGAIFYVSNNLSGSMVLDRVTIRDNTGRNNGNHKGIYAEVTDKGGTTGITVTGSTIQ